jgi:hypothetical protein
MLIFFFPFKEEGKNKLFVIMKDFAGFCECTENFLKELWGEQK